MRVVYWARMKLAKQQITEALAAVPGAELAIVESLDDLLSILPGAEALVLADAPPDQAAQVVAALNAPDCTVRWMHFVTAGREGFEAVGLPRHVKVTYPAGGVSPTVAEHAMALLLAVVRAVPAMLEHQTRRDWSRVEVSSRATSLEGKTMAIVGYGQIGREIARRARPFGMKTIAVSRTVKSDDLVDESRSLAELDEVLGLVDVVMITLALTEQTRHLFDAGRLTACRAGAYLVNVARGGLVDQTALAQSLVSGHLAGAALDVTDPEPLPASDPLWDAPNLIISPHYAGGASLASQARLAAGAASNLKRLIAGEPLQHLVE